MKKRKKRITVPVIMQMETLECGAASLAMILAYHGKWLPLEQVRSDCGVSRDGSKASNIAKAGRSYGLEVKAHRYGVDEVKENVTYPAIIHWNFNHFVVLCGFTKNAAVINDPARGTIKVTMEEFDHSFTGVCIEFTPGENFEKGGKPESVFKFLKDRLANTTASVIFVMITAVLVAFVGLVTPVFARIFTDQILPGHNMHWLEMLLVAMLFTAIFRMIVGFLNEIYLIKKTNNHSEYSSEKHCHQKHFKPMHIMSGQNLIRKYSGKHGSNQAYKSNKDSRNHYKNHRSRCIGQSILQKLKYTFRLSTLLKVFSWCELNTYSCKRMIKFFHCYLDRSTCRIINYSCIFGKTA